MLKLDEIFQNKNNSRINSLGILRPDYSTIDAAELSDEPEDWLFHPTGITFKFDAKLKNLKRNYPFADTDNARRRDLKNGLFSNRFDK